jgi:shikimate dehydrogenase
LLGVDGSYEKVEVKSGELENFLESVRLDGWTGFSLTMPLKEEIVELDILIEPIAKLSRSANTILFSDGEPTRALSTDKLAFDRLLNIGKDSKVAILGGGGTARSAAASLSGRVDHFDAFVRSPQKSRSLVEAAPAAEIRIHNFADFTVNTWSKYDLVVSTVPAGASDELALALHGRNEDFSAVRFVEVLYNPWPTELLASMRLLGAQCSDGLDLLVEQALYQISLFTGIEFDYDWMRSELLAVGLEQLDM